VTRLTENGSNRYSVARCISLNGAAKTSAFYAFNPLIAVALSFIILSEMPEWNFYVSLGIMAVGTVLIVVDTLSRNHAHMHKHYITHTHDGTTHTHVVEHEHSHTHIINDEKHGHTHRDLDPHKAL